MARRKSGKHSQKSGDKNPSYRHLFNKKSLYKDIVTERRHCMGYSIDGHGTGLLDDGFNIKKNKDGSWNIEVFIADTAFLHQSMGIKPTLNSGHSYTPREVWHKYFSLKPNSVSKLKPAVCISMKFSSDMTLDTYDIDRVMFYNQNALSYGDISNKNIFFNKQIKSAINAISKKYVRPDNFNGKSDIVETLVTLTNGILTQYAHENDLPIFYQRQAIKVEGLSQQFWTFANADHYMKKQGLLSEEQSFKRDVDYRLAKSTLTAEPSTLKSFKLLRYAKFTSPMRRLSDAINLLVVVNHLEGQPQLYNKREIQVMVGQMTGEKVKRPVVSIKSNLPIAPQNDNKIEKSPLAQKKAQKSVRQEKRVRKRHRSYNR